MAQTSVVNRYHAYGPLRDVAVAALSRFCTERVSGVVSDTLTMFNEPSEPVVVSMNGVELDRDAGDYTVNGRTVTLSRAAVVFDVFLIHYHYRAV